MKRSPLLLAAFAFVCLPALSAEGDTFRAIKTTSGKVYTNCLIVKKDPDGVIVSHQYGGAKLLFAELTAESRDALGYDAKKEAAYEKERAERKKKDREQLWKYRTELAKAQTAAYNAEARRLEAVSIQNLMGGGYGGYGYGGLGYTATYDSAFGYGNGYGNGFVNGCFNGFGNGLGNRFGIGVGRLGFAEPGYNGFPGLFGWGNRNFYTTRTPQNFGRLPGFGTLSVFGRHGIAPQPVRAPIATPAMGRLTPSLGAGAARH
jgi:hypothetical protein